MFIFNVYMHTNEDIPKCIAIHKQKLLQVQQQKKKITITYFNICTINIIRMKNQKNKQNKNE